MVDYFSRALRPSQRLYCTTKREMLDAVAMCIQFRSYLRGTKFTLRTDRKSLVWLHRFKDTEVMMAGWLHALQKFQFSIVHRPGRDHGNADGLSRVPSSLYRQCTRPDCPSVVEVSECADQPFDLVPIHSGKTGLCCLMTIFPNHRLSRVIHFAYLLCRRRIRSASRCHHEFHQELFRPGPR